MKEESRKKTVLLLRWAVIIVTSYLILFAKGKVTRFELGQVLVLAYLATNLALSFLPKAWFENPRLFYSLVIIDTGIVSLGMVLSEKVTADFYLVFFLILIFASLSRNFKLLMTIGGITSVLYGILLYSWGLFHSENNISYILRIPFIFIMTAFYGYIVQTFAREKRQQLIISESKYQTLFENANEGIVILRNPGWQIEAVNREVERLTGYERGELLRKIFINLFRQEEREQIVAYLEEISQKGEAKTDTLSILRKDGSPLEIDLSTKRVDLEGESFYQVIFRDLTEQRRLEKKIRQSKRNLEAIFDGIRDRISIQGSDFRILRVNQALAEHHQTTFPE
jgi:PAS domain S-box-containing protein